MRHATRFAGLFVLLLYVGGCGSSNPQEAAIKEMLQGLNELADVMDSVKDEASAQAAAPKLKAVAERLQALKKRTEGMTTPPSPELMKKYEEQLKNVMGRLMAAGMKAGSIPGAQAAFQDAMKAMQ